MIDEADISVELRQKILGLKMRALIIEINKVVQYGNDGAYYVSGFNITKYHGIITTSELRTTDLIGDQIIIDNS